MIQTNLIGCNWGTDPIDEMGPEGPVKGMRLNLQDPNSGQIFTIPFTGVALKDLVHASVNQLTDEQKKELAPLFTGGIIMPDGRHSPNDLRRGPQG